MKKFIYAVFTKEGNRLIVKSINKKEAERFASQLFTVVSVQRIYKTGAKSVCPW